MSRLLRASRPTSEVVANTSDKPQYYIPAHIWWLIYCGVSLAGLILIVVLLSPFANIHPKCADCGFDVTNLELMNDAMNSCNFDMAMACHFAAILPLLMQSLITTYELYRRDQLTYMHVSQPVLLIVFSIQVGCVIIRQKAGLEAAVVMIMAYECKNLVATNLIFAFGVLAKPKCFQPTVVMVAGVSNAALNVLWAASTNRLLMYPSQPTKYVVYRDVGTGLKFLMYIIAIIMILRFYYDYARKLIYKTEAATSEEYVLFFYTLALLVNGASNLYLAYPTLTIYSFQNESFLSNTMWSQAILAAAMLGIAPTFIVNQDITNMEIQIAVAEREILTRNVVLHQIMATDIHGNSPKNLKETVYPNSAVFIGDVLCLQELVDTVGLDVAYSVLGDIYKVLDFCAIICGVEKVDTVGDAYMAVAGILHPNGESSLIDSTSKIASFALMSKHCVNLITIPFLDRDAQLRIGIHCGTASVGIVNEGDADAERFCIFGDAVSMATRMEALGQADKIHCAETVVKLLTDSNSTKERSSALGTGKQKGHKNRHNKGNVLWGGGGNAAAADQSPNGTAAHNNVTTTSTTTRLRAFQGDEAVPVASDGTASRMENIYSRFRFEYNSTISQTEDADAQPMKTFWLLPGPNIDFIKSARQFLRAKLFHSFRLDPSSDLEGIHLTDPTNANTFLADFDAEEAAAEFLDSMELCHPPSPQSMSPSNSTGEQKYQRVNVMEALEISEGEVGGFQLHPDVQSADEAC